MDSQSPDVEWTPLQEAFVNNDHAMIELLLKPKLKGVTKNNPYESVYQTHWAGRINPPPPLIQHVDVGSVSDNAYGY